MKKKLFLFLTIMIMTSQTSKPITKKQTAGCAVIAALLVSGAGYYVWNSNNQLEIQLPTDTINNQETLTTNVNHDLQTTLSPNQDLTPIKKLSDKTKTKQTNIINPSVKELKEELSSTIETNINLIEVNVETLPCIVKELSKTIAPKKTIFDAIKKYQLYHGDY